MSILCVAEILYNDGGVRAFLPNSEVSNVMLIACSWPWREYYALEVPERSSGLPPGSWLANTDQLTTAPSPCYTRGMKKRTGYEFCSPGRGRVQKRKHPCTHMHALLLPAAGSPLRQMACAGLVSWLQRRSHYRARGRVRRMASWAAASTGPSSAEF